MIPTIRTQVYCTVLAEGLHSWPNCPFDEVDYLRDEHRHVFHIKAYTDVNHDDRDVEFIMLKHQIEEYLNHHFYNHERKCLVFGAMSCEMIARKLITEFNLSMCEVNEDGENGAVLTVISEEVDINDEYPQL